MCSDVGPQFGRSGISGKGKNIVTKHDPEICGRKNARKVMENVRNVFLLMLSCELSFSALMLFVKESLPQWLQKVHFCEAQHNME